MCSPCPGAGSVTGISRAGPTEMPACKLKGTLSRSQGAQEGLSGREACGEDAGKGHAWPRMEM